MTCEHCGGCHAVSEFSNQTLRDELGKRMAVAYTMRNLFVAEHDRYSTHRSVAMGLMVVSTFVVMFGWIITGAKNENMLTIALTLVMSGICTIVYDLWRWKQVRKKFAAVHQEEAKLLLG